MLATLPTACFKGDCEEEAMKWRSGAAAALAEFKCVDEEIKAKPLIFSGCASSSDGGIFLKASDYEYDTIEPGGPLLRKWFKETNSVYISYEGRSKETIQVNYKNCASWSWTYMGCLYRSPTGIRPSFTKNHKPMVEIIDSLALGDKWYFIVTRCYGCD